MYCYLKNKFKISSFLSILFSILLIISSFDTAKAQINDSINEIIELFDLVKEQNLKGDRLS